MIGSFTPNNVSTSALDIIAIICGKILLLLFDVVCYIKYGIDLFTKYIDWYLFLVLNKDAWGMWYDLIRLLFTIDFAAMGVLLIILMLNMFFHQVTSLFLLSSQDAYLVITLRILCLYFTTTIIVVPVLVETYLLIIDSWIKSDKENNIEGEFPALRKKIKNTKKKVPQIWNILFVCFTLPLCICIYMTFQFKENLPTSNFDFANIWAILLALYICLFNLIAILNPYMLDSDNEKLRWKLAIAFIYIGIFICFLFGNWRKVDNPFFTGFWNVSLMLIAETVLANMISRRIDISFENGTYRGSKMEIIVSKHKISTYILYAFCLVVIPFMNYLLPIIPSLRFRDMLAIVQSLQVTLPLIYVIMTLILDLVNALYELKNNKPSAINISAFILLLFIMLGVYIHVRKSTLLHHVGPGVWIVLFFGLFEHTLMNGSSQLSTQKHNRKRRDSITFGSKVINVKNHIFKCICAMGLIVFATNLQERGHLRIPNSIHGEMHGNNIKINHFGGNLEIQLSELNTASKTRDAKGSASSTSYAICQRKWNGLDVVDFSIFSLLAYFDAHFSKEDMAFLNESVKILYPDPLNRPIIVPVYSKMYSNNFYRFDFVEKKVSVISIRGTDPCRLRDLIEDGRLWLEAVFFKGIAAFFFPQIGIWESGLSAQFIEAMDYFQKQFQVNQESEEKAYYEHVENHIYEIRRMRKEEWKYVVTGHSLGGGLSHIIGTHLKIPGIAFVC